MALLRILWRLLVMGVAFLFAALAAIAVSAGSAVSTEGMPSLNEPIFELAGKIGLIGLAGISAIAILGGPVAVIAALVGEVFRFRSWVYYALAGGLASISGIALFNTAAFSQRELMAIIASGLVAGLVYWLIAGRSAGFLRDTPR